VVDARLDDGCGLNGDRGRGTFSDPSTCEDDMRGICVDGGRENDPRRGEDLGAGEFVREGTSCCDEECGGGPGLGAGDCALASARGGLTRGRPLIHESSRPGVDDANLICYNHDTSVGSCMQKYGT
jgi:hypothetical protein